MTKRVQVKFVPLYDIQLFNYEGNAVRIVEINGSPYWVAKDICDILGYSNSRKAINDHLDDDEISDVTISDGRQNRNMNVISESGLYCLILRSNKPQAKEFRKWVTATVLPQIRKTGSYSAKPENITKSIMYSAKMILEAAHIKDNQLALALDRVAQHYTGQSVLALSGIVLEAPTNNQLLTPTQIGKHFGVSGRKVNEIPEREGYQEKIAGLWQPLELGEPFAVMIDTGKTHSNGAPVRQLKWNSSIIDEIAELLPSN